MKYLLAAISTIALAATPALAQGNGNGNRGGQVDHSNHGGGKAERENRGGGNAERDTSERDNRGNGNNQRSNSERGNSERGNRDRDNAQRGDAQRGDADRSRQAVRPSNRGNGNGNGNRNGNNANREGQADNNGNRGNDNGRARNSRDGGLIDRILYRETGLINGCPPGLAAKRNGCLPPGQARKRDRSYRYGSYAPNWWGLPYDSGNYFYEDGFLMRYDGDRISGYIPLLGGALSIGNSWPSEYGYDRVPDYYSSYYGFGDDYRYADNVVYRVNPETAAITSIAALLTGEEFTVGQPAPRGYDVYNVPYSHRDRYQDGPDARYRYNDGYIYQIDPETRLIAAAIELLI